MESPTQLSDLQEQINTWKTDVNIVREDLQMMQERLAQLALSKTNPAIMARVEHFQNRFIRQGEVADEMYHDLKQSAKKISANGQLKVIHDDRPVDDYEVLQERMETFQKLFEELKNDFNQFIPACQ
jgi:archaellum component FlaC